MSDLVGPSTVKAQPYGTPSPAESGPGDAKPAGSQTTITPSISVSERYDSNVYFIPGKNLQDYITTVSPQVKVDHQGRLVDATMTGGIQANYYLRDPGLSYIGGNGLFDLDLGRLVANVVRGASLKMSDSFFYTPQPPAFLAPTGGNVLDTGFVQGVQVGRANAFSNMGQASAGYQLSPTTSLQASYSNSLMRFGKRFTPPGQSSPFTSSNYFTTNYQVVTGGPKILVSPLDSLSLNYQYKQMSFNRLGIKSTFEMQGAIVGWTRKLTPTLNAQVTGGFTVITPGNTLQYIGSALVQWSHENTSVKAQYQRSIMPSFFLAGVPLVNQGYSLTATHQITERLSITGIGNYAQNASAEPTLPLSITSYGFWFGVTYQLAQHVSASTFYSYNHYNYNFLGTETLFSRHMVNLSIQAEW